MAELAKFDGIETDAGLRPIISKSLELVLQLAGSSQVAGVLLPSALSQLALMSAISTATALFAASGARCTLAAPSADIEPVQDANGDLVLRCLHSPAHMWDYGTGKRL